jgi:acetyl esterase/lipase
MMRGTMERLARAGLLTALLLLLIGVAGCGGGGDDDGPNSNFGGARVSWGEPASGNPKAVVMLLHGGGWQPSPAGYEGQKKSAPVLQDQGYATVAIGYDAGAKGFRQIVEVYKEARRQYPDLPICASGISAGGHLALMLATREPDLDCVMALSSPVDLTTLAEQDPEDEESYDAAVKAFGAGKLATFSPVRYADRIRAKVLLIQAEDDPLVPVEQADELKRALPDAQVLILETGDTPAVFAHGGGVQEDAQNTVIEREFDFLQQSTVGGS